MKKILITGSTGFVGKHLSARLMKEGYEIVSMSHDLFDVTDKESFENIDFNQVDVVVHLASKTFVPDSWNDPESFYKTNVIGTVNILEKCKQYNMELVYLSSYVYGEPLYLPVDETHKIQYNNLYAHTKIVAEELCEFYRSNFNLKINILRPFNIYGPYQKESFLIPTIIKQLLEGDDVIVNNPFPKRDYIYIDDVTRFIQMLIESDESDTYNIGYGKSYSVQEIFDIVQPMINGNAKLINKNIVRPNEINDLYCDNSKAQSKLKWKPLITIEEGLFKIIEKHKRG